MLNLHRIRITIYLFRAVRNMWIL